MLDISYIRNMCNRMGIDVDDKLLQHCMNYLNRESLNIFSADDREKLYSYMSHYVSQEDLAKIRGIAEQFLS